MKLHLFGLALTALASVGIGTQEPAPKQEVVSGELGKAVNVHRLGKLWFAGQFTPEDIAALKQSGIERVITTRGAAELDWDEAAQVVQAGIEHVAVPFRQPDTLTNDVFGQIRGLLKAEDASTLFHCGSANRVAATWLPFRVLDQGVALEQALAEAKVIGLRTEAYKQLAIAYIEGERAKGVGRESSVFEGINDEFKDAELDVDKFIGLFEVESREVYLSRAAVLKAVGVKPGMRVADIGAGTGLYSFLFSEAVGPDGWVFAIDIAPRFLEHIRTTAASRNVSNIGGVLCAENSVSLPPESVDLAYVCDTYHHFEYPLPTTRSIHRALKKGGRLIVVDFERIPGESAEWVLGHVRAGKADFQAEILKAGFRLLREVKVEGLKENYFLEFIKD